MLFSSKNSTRDEGVPPITLGLSPEGGDRSPGTVPFVRSLACWQKSPTRSPLLELRLATAASGELVPPLEYGRKQVINWSPTEVGTDSGSVEKICPGREAGIFFLPETRIRKRNLMMVREGLAPVMGLGWQGGREREREGEGVSVECAGRVEINWGTKPRTSRRTCKASLSCSIYQRERPHLPPYKAASETQSD